MDVVAALVQARRQGLDRVAVALDQEAVALALLERVQLAALEVLDQAHLENLAVVEVAHERRNRHQPGRSRGRDAPVTGDRLVAHVVVGLRAQEDGLQHPVALNALGQVLDVSELAVAGGGVEQLELDVLHPATHRRELAHGELAGAQIGEHDAGGVKGG